MLTPQRNLALFLVLFLAPLLSLCSLSACSPSMPEFSVANLTSPIESTTAQTAEARAHFKSPTQTELPPELEHDETGNVYLRQVPFVQQEDDNTCAQAAMTMLLQFWKRDLTYAQVIAASNPLKISSSYQAVQNYLYGQELQVQAYHNGNLAALESEILSAHPTLVLLDLGGLTQEHYVLVVGFNARQNTVILHDSRSEPYRIMPVSEFLQRWDNPALTPIPLLGNRDYYRLYFQVQD